MEIITTYAEYTHTWLLPPNQEREYIALVRGSEAGIMNLSDTGEGVWKLDGLFVYPIFRRQGVAKRLVSEACAFADENGLGMILRACPTDERTRVEWLQTLYAKYGFTAIFNSGRLNRTGGLGHMTRLPRTSAVIMGSTAPVGVALAIN